MVVKKTSRFGAETYTAGTDPHPNRLKFNSETELFDALAAIAHQGATGDRPPAGTINRLFWDATVKRLYWDDGTVWNEITTNGGGGAGLAIVPGATAGEGTSGRSARADHTHYFPFATAAVDGAMSRADKAKLDGASAVASPGSLVLLDNAGRTQVAAPSASADASNKGYVDTQVATRALSTHMHPVAQISDAGATGINVVKAATQAAAKTAVGLGNVDNTTDQDKPVSTATNTALGGKANSSHTHPANEVTGVLAPSQLPTATSSAQGAMSAADKAKVDNASVTAASNTLALRSSGGQIQVATPGSDPDAANRGYVDAQVGTRAPSSHTHPWADVLGKPSTFAPTAHSHSWAETTGKPTTFTPTSHTHTAAETTSGVFNAARLPTATSSAQGAMSAADKAKLDAATADANPNSLLWRDAWGRAKISDPVGADDVANQRAVDAAMNTRAPSNHTHSWNSITGIPNASASTAGIMSAADKKLLDGASTSGWANTLVIRDSAGKFGIQPPNNSDHPTTKIYVDTAINGRAPSSHSHSWGSITNKADIYNTNAGTGSYRAVWVNSGGTVGYNLSSRKYKANERTYAPDAQLLDAVEPKWFQYKTDIAEQGVAAPWRVNFIAEDLHNAGLTEYVSYDGEGTTVEHAETINEQLIVNALWAFAKQQRAQITELLGRVEALEGQA